MPLYPGDVLWMRNGGGDMSPGGVVAVEISRKVTVLASQKWVAYV